MNYQRVYNSIIEKAKSENRSKGKGIYYENHHIIPRCLSGSDEKENLVLLTRKEHYICHKLLTYIYPGNKSIFYGWFCMAFIFNKNHEKIFISLREYDHIRRLNSEMNAGKNNPNYGGKITGKQEVKDKIRNTLKGNKLPKDVKEKISNSCRNFFSIKENRDKCSLPGELNGMYGINVYDVFIEKYGKEKADELWNKKRNEHSRKMSGNGNPMSGVSVYDNWLKKYGKEEADRRMKVSNEKRSKTWELKRIKKLNIKV